MPVVLETQRLRLRELGWEDLEPLAEILSDEETMAHYPAPFDRAKVERWISWNLENYRVFGFGLWAVEEKGSGAFLGDCGITIQNIDGVSRPEIGYHINKRFWRRGYGSEAACACRDWAFAHTPFGEVYSYMKKTNLASRATAMANGMELVKEYEEKDGGTHLVYAITKARWEGLRM